MLKQLKINHLRNLVGVELTLTAHNVFIGDNGSGKTSLLESIFLLARGKSFRHFDAKRYINHNADTCTVWASVGDDGLNDNGNGNGDFDESFAIAKHKSADTPTQLRHNQSPLPSQAVLTKRLPTLIIDPSGMDILEDGTASRRQLLDWLCFYCNEGFHQIWLDYQRIIKHRNALLKSAQNIPADSHQFNQLCQQIDAWDTSLAVRANELHAIRMAVFEVWQGQFIKIINDLLPAFANQIRLSYTAGFDTDSDFKTLLSERIYSDIELGYTRIGSHRADLSISLAMPTDNGKTHKTQAVNVLSRGQKKLLIIALKLSGLAQVCQATSHTPLVLIDDIDSELDNTARAILLDKLTTLPCQLFISSLNDDILENLNNDQLSVFYLNDGTVQCQP